MLTHKTILGLIFGRDSLGRFIDEEIKEILCNFQENNRISFFDLS